MLITLDFETFYSQQFSLTKLTTEAYIRSPEFETIGVAIKIDDGPTRWYPQPQVEAALAEIDWSEAFMLAQNTAFDAAILAWRYDVHPKVLLDTLGMSRALFPHEKSHSLAAQAQRADLGVKGDEVIHALGKRYADFDADSLARYGRYCCNDVDLTYALFKHYIDLGFPQIELKLIDLTLRMFTEPRLRLDSDLLIEHLREVKERKQALMDAVSDRLGLTDDAALKKSLMSNEKFAQLLRERRVVPPTKVSPTTGKEAYAFAKTDEEFLALQDHPDECVQALVAARLGNKSTIEETRTERFIEMSGRGAFPVPLRYYGAHSGRWSGQDMVNLHNLPSRGPMANKIKQAILPPPGHVIIDCDSAQIEARTLAWLAGQDDLVEAFRNKEDVYKLMASRIYGKPAGEIDRTQRQVGKTVILGCGYGVGHKKLRAFLKIQAGVEVEESEAKRIVDTYRQANNRIADLWRKADDALTYLHGKMTTRIDPRGLIVVAPGKGLTLPNKLHIQYPGLRREELPTGKTTWVYDSKGETIHIYGGKAVENCIAKGTDVLTSRGWVPIEDVRRTDLVHDGVDFVPHGGTVFKSVQACVTVDGVLMTPDHEVLTDDGWKAASQNPRPYRPDLRGVDHAACREPWRGQGSMAIPVPVRGAGCKARGGRNQGMQTRRHAQLWVYDSLADIRQESAAWHVEASGVRGVAQHARSLSASVASCVAQLRRAWDHGMRAMAGTFRELLGGYGGYVPAGAGFGPQRQRWPVQPGELRVGDTPRQCYEQAQHRATSRRGGVEQADRYKHHDALLSTGTRVAGNAIDTSALSAQPVYDIINAGPRQRFVVQGATGPFVVHNCTQAIARCIVAEQMLRISRRYPVVLTVHDSVACIAPQDKAQEAQQFVEDCMRWAPAWAKDLPLACESGVGESYGAC